MVSFEKELIEQYLSETHYINFNERKRLLSTRPNNLGIELDCTISTTYMNGIEEIYFIPISILGISGWILNKINNINRNIK